MTIEEYLKGKTGYSITDDAIRSILFDRNVSEDSDASSLSQREKDLCVADLFRWILLNPSISASVEDADGGWKHKEGSSQMSDSDKSFLRQEANRIYDLYGEERIMTSKMHIVNFGLRTDNYGRF